MDIVQLVSTHDFDSCDLGSTPDVRVKTWWSGIISFKGMVFYSVCHPPSPKLVGGRLSATFLKFFKNKKAIWQVKS